MDDPASGRHPLHVAGSDHATVAQAVAMLDLATQHVGDGLHPPMGMPGEPFHVEVRLVGPEVVEQQEGIVDLRATPTDRTMKVDASTFDGRAALDNLANEPVLCHG